MSDVDHIVQARRDYSRRRRLAFYYANRIHPEALDWQARILAAGSSVSASTLQAASDLCKAIDAAGIRDRFVRLNPFGGNNLTAALVPLYRSTVPFAAVVGNATDTNVNFVGADYTTNGGIQGKATAYLQPGVNSSVIAADNSHASLISTAASADLASGNRDLGVSTIGFGLIIRFNSSFAGYYYSKGANLGFANESFGTEVGHFVACRTSTNAAFVSRNGSVILSPGTHAGSSTADGSILVFSQLLNGAETSKRRLAGYSFGSSMSTAQALAYSQAISAFCATLGRPLT